MRYRCIIVLFCLLAGSSGFAEQGYGVEVIAQAPPDVELYPGEVFTMSFLIRNVSGQGDTFVQRIDAPEGWETIPPTLFPFELAAGQEVAKIISVRIPKYANTGTYELRYEIQGTSGAGMISSASVTINVKSMSEVINQVVYKPSRAAAGARYSVKMRLTNNGNSRVPMGVRATNRNDYPIEIVPHPPYDMEPGESREYYINVDVPKRIERKFRHIFEIDVYNDETMETLSAQTVAVDVYPIRGDFAPKKYRTIPTVAEFVYGHREGKDSLFVNISGKGYVDAAEKQTIEFLFRAPAFQQTDVYRIFGGAPEKYYLKYDAPRMMVYLGDGQYGLSPLIMDTRYGRGTHFQLKGEKIEAGGVYVARKKSFKQSNAAAYVRLFPKDNLSVNANYMHSKGRLYSQIVDERQSSNSVSLFGEYKKDQLIDLQLEGALSYGMKLNQSRGSAYYAKARGRPIRDFWFDLTKVWANPDYVGYYQDMDQVTAACGFPVFRQLRTSIAYNSYDVNLNNNPLKESSVRSHNFRAELSYPFPDQLYTTVSMNYFRSRDPLQQMGYHTKFGGLRITKNFKKLNFQGTADIGRYYNNLSFLNDRQWQRYQAYLSLSPTIGQNYSLYGRWGYENLSTNIHWNNTYGISTTFQSLKKSSLRLQYEYTHRHNLFYRHFYQALARYSFQNKSRVELKVLYWQQSNIKDTFQLLFTYTLPWNLPIDVDRSRSRLKGRVMQKEGEDNKSVGSVLVGCGEELVYTDDKGKFYFPDMPPGMLPLWYEGAYDGWVSEEPLPVNVELVGGKELKRDLMMVKPAKVFGKVKLHAFKSREGEISSLEGMVYEEGSSEYETKGGLARARLQLISEDKKQIIELYSDSNGEFTFDHIRPGKWTLKIDPSALNVNQFVDQGVQEIVVSPSQEVGATFEVFPKRRVMRMLE